MPLVPIPGTDEPEEIIGGTDAESITGEGGNDTIDAFDGDDLAYGGTGDDRVQGGYGDDTLYGDDGNDGVYAGWGDDAVYGGAGNDAFIAFDGTGQDSAYGGDGNDYLYWSQQSSGEFDGGDGIDHLAVSTNAFPTVPVTADISTGSGTFLASGITLSFTSVERLTVYGGSAGDTVTGGSYRDIIQVYDGANVVDAGAGNDVVVYAARLANTLYGGDGDDLLYAGGSEFDPLDFTVYGGVVDDSHGSDITGFERFAIYGGRSNDFALTGDGRDRLHGYFGNDTLDGGAGNDLIKGQVHDDSLYGGDGDDRLLGGRGLDALTGGAGRDTFVFTQTDYADMVNDFVSGEDVLRIRTAIFGIPVGTVPVLSLDGPTGEIGQFVYDTSDGDLFWDPDGTGVEARIVLGSLASAPVLTVDDITLF